MPEKPVDETPTPVTAPQRVTLKRLALPSSISVMQLAERMGASPIEVIKQFMRTGLMTNINQVVDIDTASTVTRAFGYAASHESIPATSVNRPADVPDVDPTKLVTRPPVVTILGHVDHGKTTLLDAIRNTNVVATELGGITQNIGAHQVEYNHQKITFLDTPGHEAFTAMRARGTQVTDVAVLVVAADDGVMPQTIEAISHVKAAGVPIVVAINKIDMPDTDTAKIKRQLVEHELIIEEWGGEVIAIPVSAKTGDGIPDLLESILVTAEVSDLKANPDRPAIGVVVESRLDKNRGPIATVLVQTGTLFTADNVVVANIRGRIKAMISDTGARVTEAGPSTPVEIMGLSDIPQAGEQLIAVADERTAREIVEKHTSEATPSKRPMVTLEGVLNQIRRGDVKALNLILKTGVQGSIDAVKSVLERVSTDETKVNLIHAASGAITESDVMLALATKALVIGFNIRPGPSVRQLADSHKIEIRCYDVIYKLGDDVQSALNGLLEPTYQEIIEGKAEVRAVFSLGRRGKAAGCHVTEGRIKRTELARVTRNGEVLFEGHISSLKRFKDDVREVSAGHECGLGVKGFTDWEEGDCIESIRQQQTGTS